MTHLRAFPHLWRATPLVLALASASVAFAAPSADITVIPPAGGGFVVKNQAGTVERLRVMETGDVFLPSLSNAQQAGSVACYDGPTGRMGPCSPSAGAGAQGPAGPAGPTGAAGPVGASGDAGPQGVAGPQGATGATGATGAAGATGPTGTAGGKIVFSSSGSGLALSTTLGGNSNQSSLLPLNGFVADAAEVGILGGTINLSASGSQGAAAAATAQTLGADMTLRSIAARIELTQSLVLVGSTLTVNVRVHTAPESLTQFTELWGATCSMAPAFTGVLVAGTTASCLVTGLNIPLAAGSRAVVAVTPSVSAGLDVAATVPVIATVSLHLE
jgi:hypothetical protein